ncbi:hypothetical protein HID58_092200 [Brassica napus]|uniref:Uncharacterized protein n=2 Tax=Brassica napus TaxID=3708 RepID=A0ABQ7WX94_BRANA|nr:hypothetical protein HID58_092200 [Brassica napus]
MILLGLVHYVNEAIVEEETESSWDSLVVVNLNKLKVCFDGSLLVAVVAVRGMALVESVSVFDAVDYVHLEGVILFAASNCRKFLSVLRSG